MRGIRTAGLCLVAAVAMGCVFAASASATLKAPNWAICAKASPKNTGKYKNKTCTEVNSEGKGAYELKEGVGKGKAFKGKGPKTKKGVRDIVLHVKTFLGDLTVACESATDAGKPAAPNLVKEVSVAYKGCEALGTKPCKSAAAKEGEIKITGLGGQLGYVEEGATPVVGLRLENETTPGGVISEFVCTGGKTVEAKIRNQVIGVVSKDINTPSKEFELFFEATERYGEHEFEGKKYKPSVNILGWAPEVAAIEACEGKECAETEHPAHILNGEFCGPLIEELLGTECNPPAYLGLDQTLINKGEDLMVKTEP